MNRILLCLLLLLTATQPLHAEVPFEAILLEVEAQEQHDIDTPPDAPVQEQTTEQTTRGVLPSLQPLPELDLGLCDN